MKISVIIPALNEEATIGKLIESLKRDPYPNKEVLVVDGGSTDGTIERAREKGAIIIMEKGTRCPANARNQGAEESRGEVLCFLDADIERVSENFITNAVGHFGKDRVVGVVAEREWIEKSLAEKTTRSVRSMGLIRAVGRRELKDFSPPNFLRREVFLEVGGYPLMGFGEDRIFWRKLKRYVGDHDCEIVREESSKFFRHGVKSFRDIFKRYQWYGRTISPYLKRTSSLFGKASALAPSVWLISMASIFLIPFFHPIFILSIPYLVRLALIIHAGTKNKFCFLIPLLDIVGGIGFLKGMLRGGGKLGR